VLLYEIIILFPLRFYTWYVSHGVWETNYGLRALLTVISTTYLLLSWVRVETDSSDIVLLVGAGVYGTVSVR